MANRPRISFLSNSDLVFANHVEAVPSRAVPLDGVPHVIVVRLLEKRIPEGEVDLMAKVIETHRALVGDKVGRAVADLDVRDIDKPTGIAFLGRSPETVGIHFDAAWVIEVMATAAFDVDLDVIEGKGELVSHDRADSS